MPVVMNSREQRSDKSVENRPAIRMQAVTQGGLLSDVKTVVAIVVGVLLLAVGLFGWSQGWFGGAGAAPANAASQTAGKMTAPLGGSDDSGSIGKKRNKGMGE